jgi:hypothetical protein
VSYLTKVISSRGECFFKYLAKDHTGKDAWYFVMVDKPRVDAFSKIKAGQAINLGEYGKVIASGYGTTPPESAFEDIASTYGVTFH